VGEEVGMAKIAGSLDVLGMRTGRGYFSDLIRKIRVIRGFSSSASFAAVNGFPLVLTGTIAFFQLNSQETFFAVFSGKMALSAAALAVAVATKGERGRRTRQEQTSSPGPRSGCVH
jgi:hypothetical protein